MYATAFERCEDFSWDGSASLARKRIPGLITSKLSLRVLDHKLMLSTLITEWSTHRDNAAYSEVLLRDGPCSIPQRY